MPLEQPSSGPGSSPEKQNSFTLSKELRSLSAIIGEAPGNEQAPSDLSLMQRIERIAKDNRVDTFHEQSFSNRSAYTLDALRQRNALEQREQPQQEQLDELQVTEQAVTYFEYLPEAAGQLRDIMQRYEKLRTSMPSVSSGIQEQEAQARLYLRALDSAIRERVAFANVTLIQNKLAAHPSDVHDPAALHALREKYMASSDLSDAARSDLLDQRKAGKRMNMLDQRIVDILAGSAVIQGVERDFVPQKMYLALLTEEYTNLLEEGKKISRQGKRVNDSAAQTKRKELTTELVRVTDEMARYQMRVAELSTIQHQFGDLFDLANAEAPKSARTPRDMREKIQNLMARRSEFHLQQTGEFMSSVKNEVLSVGLMEHVENFSSHTGRDVLLGFARAAANLYAAPVPAFGGLKEFARQRLVGPLEDSLGWPPGKHEWGELTPDEQKTVLEKRRSIVDAIRSFDRTTITRFETTLSMIQNMPPASTYVGQRVREPLPTEDVTPANRDALVEQYGGPTVYRMLFQQLQESWGDPEDGTGFIGEYARLFEKFNENTSVKLDVSGALHQMNRNWNDLAAALLAAGGWALFLGTIGWQLLKRTPRMLKDARNAKRLRDTQEALKALRAENETLRNAAKVRGASGAGAEGQAVRETLKKSPKLLDKVKSIASRAAKIGGGIATAITALLAAKGVVEAMSMRELDDLEASLAGLELMTQHPDINRDEHSGYEKDIESLEKRIQLLSMSLAAKRPITYPVEGTEDMQRLREDADALRLLQSAVAARAGEAYRAERARFPIEDIMGRSLFDAKPNVRVNFSALDEVRAKGRQNEKQQEEGKQTMRSLQGKKRQSIFESALEGSLNEAMTIDENLSYDDLLKNLETIQGLQQAYLRLERDMSLYELKVKKVR